MFKKTIVGVLLEARCDRVVSGSCGGAPLQQEGVAHVAHPHGSRVGRQGQLVTGATVAVDVAAVPTVVLQRKHGELMNPWRANECVTAKP